MNLVCIALEEELLYIFEFGSPKCGTSLNLKNVPKRQKEETKQEQNSRHQLTWNMFLHVWGIHIFDTNAIWNRWYTKYNVFGCHSLVFISSKFTADIRMHMSKSSALLQMCWLSYNSKCRHWSVLHCDCVSKHSTECAQVIHKVYMCFGSIDQSMVKLFVPLLFDLLFSYNIRDEYILLCFFFFFLFCVFRMKYEYFCSCSAQCPIKTVNWRDIKDIAAYPNVKKKLE